MRTKLLLALREVQEQMDDSKPLFGEDWLETFHFLQTEFLDHSNAIGTKLEIRWNPILKDQDFWLSVWRFKEASSEFDFFCNCSTNPETMMDLDEVKGQRQHVKDFIDQLIKSI